MANKDEIDGMGRRGAEIRVALGPVSEQMRRVVEETLWEDALGNPKIDERDLTEELAKLIYAIYDFAVTSGLQVDAAFDAVRERRIAELSQARRTQDDGE